MKHSKRKKRRSKPAKQPENPSVRNFNGESEKERIFKSLMEAFSLASIEEAKAAYEEANDDPNKAADLLTSLSDNSEVPTSSCSSSSQSFEGSNGKSDFKGLRGKNKKVVAATGTVSTVLGKGYVSSSPRKELLVVKQKRSGATTVNIEETEQFLCSMLGDGCELNMGVVKDVLCNCQNDVEKALEVLLELSASPCETSSNYRYSSFSASSREDPKNIDCSDNFWQLTDRGSDSNSHSSESEAQESLQLLDITYRKYAEALIDSSNKLPGASPRVGGSELSQQVLESLFNIPRSSEREPAAMNWRNVVKKMESFAQMRAGLCPAAAAGPQLNTRAKGAEYQVFREAARQQWDNMKTCYQRAAAAYSNGEKNYAAYMSEQGKLYSKMAQEADEKASMEIFKARNKAIENVITIDLHGQHVKPAMRLVKLHLLFGTNISSVQHLRIITGCGSHGIGKSKLKQSVVNLVKKEGIEWREENQGTVIIRLEGPREFSFLDSGSDSDSE